MCLKLATLNEVWYEVVLSHSSVRENILRVTFTQEIDRKKCHIESQISPDVSVEDLKMPKKIHCRQNLSSV